MRVTGPATRVVARPWRHACWELALALITALPTARPLRGDLVGPLLRFGKRGHHGSMVIWWCSARPLNQCSLCEARNLSGPDNYGSG